MDLNFQIYRVCKYKNFDTICITITKPIFTRIFRLLIFCFAGVLRPLGNFSKPVVLKVGCFQFPPPRGVFDFQRKTPGPGCF